MMFKPLLAFGLILGSLLMLVPQPTTGYTVKLLGDDNTYGEGHVESSDGEDKKPPVDDDDDALIIEIPSEELELDKLMAGNDMTNEQIDMYLSKYGYLAKPSDGPISVEDRELAIKDFQRFSRLTETGVVDTHTAKKMKLSRCGLSDPGRKAKVTNFKAQGSIKWRKNDLTYKIVTYSAKLPAAVVKEWTAKAFKMWSDATQLTFTEIKTGQADIRISFTPREHGDGYPFDGAGGVLAHAFFPERGDVHMDEAETWTIESQKGINLLFVLVHEFGHALGLGHSSVKDAIMEPYYNGYEPSLALHADDIAGIQFLYGKPTGSEPTTKPPVTKPPVTKPPVTKPPVTKPPVTGEPNPTDPTPPARKFRCPFPFWATMTVGDKTYGFYSRNMYEILPNGRLTGRRSIKTVYPGSRGYVGAAAHNEETGHTFLFLGRRVWRYTNNKLDAGFPKNLKSYIRAAVVVDNSLIAFSFRHVHYLDEDTMEDLVDGELTIKDEYPGLSGSIRTAASYSDSETYIFYTRRIVKLDVFTGEMEDVITCPRSKTQTRRN